MDHRRCVWERLTIMGGSSSTAAYTHKTHARHCHHTHHTCTLHTTTTCLLPPLLSLPSFLHTACTLPLHTCTHTTHATTYFCMHSYCVSVFIHGEGRGNGATGEGKCPSVMCVCCVSAHTILPPYYLHYSIIEVMYCVIVSMMYVCVL